MIEIWKNIHTQYTASNYGKVLEIASKKPVRILLDKDAYPCVILSNHNPTKIRIKNLIARLFLPNPNHYRYVKNINGNKRDNRVVNLQWVNQIQKYTRYGNKAPYKKLNESKVEEIKILLEQNCTQKEIAETYQVSTSCIQRIANGETWKCIRI